MAQERSAESEGLKAVYFVGEMAQTAQDMPTSCYKTRIFVLRTITNRTMLRLLNGFLLFLLSLSLGAQGLRSNIALGWNAGTDSASFRPLNVGVLGNVQRLKGMQLGLLSAFVHKDAKGLNLGGIFAGTWGEMQGVQMGLAVAVAREGIEGWQHSLLANYVGAHSRGLQSSFVVNAAPEKFTGMQLAGVANMANHVCGVQLAGLTNLAGPNLYGAQIATFANVAMAVERGMQFSIGLNFTDGTMRGLQLGTMNYADTLSGWQVGVVNVGVRHPKGAQIGIVNIGGDSEAFRLGLVNVDANTQIQLLGFAGTGSKLNLAARFLNRRTYSMLGVGTHYFGLDKDFSGALFYRTGRHFSLAPKWRLLGDVGFSHIESLSHNMDEDAERLYALSGRVGVDFQCARDLGVFLALGIEHARFYHHNTAYRTRPIVELGVTLFR